MIETLLIDKWSKTKKSSEWFSRMHQLTSKWRTEKFNTFYVIVIKHIDYLLDLLKFLCFVLIFFDCKNPLVFTFYFLICLPVGPYIFNQNADKIVTYSIFFFFLILFHYIFFTKHLHWSMSFSQGIFQMKAIDSMRSNNSFNFIAKNVKRT